jgi:iron(III) transport system ATP-binding protein
MANGAPELIAALCVLMGAVAFAPVGWPLWPWEACLVPPASVKLDAVCKQIGDQAVLDAFSVALRAGERMAILGPSGCGKTTVLRLVAGLLVPDSGSVVLDDIIVSSAGRVRVPPERRNVGMVFQDLAL